MLAPPAGALGRHREFTKLWAGQTISLIGSQVTLLALPLTAIVLLQATPFEVGVLRAAQSAPFLLVGLLAGVWVDRLRRRPILVATDVGRAVLLGTIPAAAAAGVLRLEHLFVVAFAAGVLTVFFDIAYQAFLPSLVRREDLVEGNARLETSRSLAQIVGPGAAGLLIELITAPLAIAADAGSFVISALFVQRVRAEEPAAAVRPRRGLGREMKEGLAVVLGSPVLRAIAGCTATLNFCYHMLFAVYLLYATRELSLSPATLGLVFAAGGPSALAGSLAAGPAARRFGLGPTIVGAAFVHGAAMLLVPMAARSSPAALPCLVAAQVLYGFAVQVYNVNQVSLRQGLTADHLQGRMNASMRFMVWGTMPLGSLTGGLVGEALGLRPTLAVAALGMSLAFLWVLRSPLRRHAGHRPPQEIERCDTRPS